MDSRTQIMFYKKIQTFFRIFKPKYKKCSEKPDTVLGKTSIAFRVEPDKAYEL